MEDSELKGRLEETAFPQVIAKIFRSKETGILNVTHRELHKQVFFQDGKAVFARSNDPDERLGPFLLRQGKVTYRNLAQCEQKVAPNKRLGTILVLEGCLHANDLYPGVVDQVKEIIYNLFEWQEGEFRFERGNLPTQEVIVLNMSNADLIISGISRIWRWSQVKKGSADLDAVFRKKEGWSTIVRSMAVTAEVEILIDMLDEPRTLGEILQLSPLSNFQTCRLIWAFSIIGIVDEILSAPTWEQPEVTAAVSAATAETVIEVLPEKTAEIPTPTLKITLETSQDQIPSPTAPPPVPSVAAETASKTAELEPLPPPIPTAGDAYITNPGIELSFADLRDLNEEAEEVWFPKEPVPAARPERWQVLIHQDLKEFNESHRYLYEMVRLELGAGASNFLLKVFRRVCAKYPLVWDGVPMDEFGEFDEQVLSLNIEANQARNYEDALDTLLEEEQVAIRLFLDRKRVEAIEAGLDRIIQNRKMIAH